MSIGDVNKIRQRSKSRDNGPWVTDYEQMVRKTLIRRMANYLPMSIELQQAIQISDAQDEGKRAAIDSTGFVVVEDDDDENVDTETGEITSNSNPDPDDDPMRQIEQQPQQSGGFNPTAEEIAAIHVREMAEAQQSAPSSSQRRGRGQSGLGIE